MIRRRVKTQAGAGWAGHRGGAILGARDLSRGESRWIVMHEIKVSHYAAKPISYGCSQSGLQVYHS